MRFADCVDYGDALETHVSGIASVDRISEHMIRVTYYTEKTAAGAVERRATIHLVWDMANWLVSQAAVHQAMGDFVREILVNPRDGAPH